MKNINFENRWKSFKNIFSIIFTFLKCYPLAYFKMCVDLIGYQSKFIFGNIGLLAVVS